ncbi:MAG: tetratricopeptide repeat protein [Clostridia bacterium]|nr:tetratricopeptide repeat protein [Clostridia bacterium]
MSDHVPSPIPEEPDILIQDLEDIPQSDITEPQEEQPVNRCARCDCGIPENEEYCDDCLSAMQAYPVAPGAWIGAILCALVGLFGLFVLGVNLLIAHPVVQGDEALAADDLKTCFTYYADSYNVATRLNDLLFPHAELSFFTNGSRTMEKQILAQARLNGPYQAGLTIESNYGQNPPKALRGIYEEYQDISAFVIEMQQAVSDYRDSLPAGATGDYDEMNALVDAAVEKLPRTPSYLAQYYRFSVSYSAADDNARTCALLDKLIEMQPDALWLYASEGIHAYDQDGQYVKAFDICKDLSRLDASNTATVAYTVMQLRLMKQYDNALTVYDRALTLTEPSSEMQRQKAIVLMLRGEYDEAQTLLVESYDPSTATLEHLATIALCAHAAGDKAVYKEYKTLLDSYVPFEQVDLFAAGEITLEDIFLTGGGEVV